MTHGFDTSFLVAAEVPTHPSYAAARERLQGLRKAGDTFAITPQVLTEFIHVVSDPRRFTTALTMETATARAATWWDTPEVVQILPIGENIHLFFDSMHRHRLGWKRVLDTLLAATYRNAAVPSILTTNVRDFSVFGWFAVVEP